MLTSGTRQESHAATIGYQAARWQSLPQLPAGRAGGSAGQASSGRPATLAAGAGGAPQALMVSGSTLTVWQLGSGSWTLMQTVRVPIPYGSSG